MKRLSHKEKARRMQGAADAINSMLIGDITGWTAQQIQDARDVARSCRDSAAAALVLAEKAGAK